MELGLRVSFGLLGRIWVCSRRPITVGSSVLKRYLVFPNYRLLFPSAAPHEARKLVAICEDIFGECFGELDDVLRILCGNARVNAMCSFIAESSESLRPLE